MRLASQKTRRSRFDPGCPLDGELAGGTDFWPVLYGDLSTRRVYWQESRCRRLTGTRTHAVGAGKKPARRAGRLEGLAGGVRTRVAASFLIGRSQGAGHLTRLVQEAGGRASDRRAGSCPRSCSAATWRRHRFERVRPCRLRTQLGYLVRRISTFERSPPEGAIYGPRARPAVHRNSPARSRAQPAGSRSASIIPTAPVRPRDPDRGPRISILGLPGSPLWIDLLREPRPVHRTLLVDGRSRTCCASSRSMRTPVLRQSPDPRRCVSTCWRTH